MLITLLIVSVVFLVVFTVGALAEAYSDFTYKAEQRRRAALKAEYKKMEEEGFRLPEV